MIIKNFSQSLVYLPAHGVLRLILLVKGDKIRQADPRIGLLLIVTEKLIEWMVYFVCLDRLDYFTKSAPEHIFCLVTESLLNIKVILLEITRIFHSLLTFLLPSLLQSLLHFLLRYLTVGCHVITPFLWCFKEREKLIQNFKRILGVHMYSNFIRNISLIPLSEIEYLLNTNIFWFNKFNNIAILSVENSFNRVNLCSLGILCIKYYLKINKND